MTFIIIVEVCGVVYFFLRLVLIPYHTDGETYSEWSNNKLRVTQHLNLSRSDAKICAASTILCHLPYKILKWHFTFPHTQFLSQIS